ncbi:hypothetical protein [Cupriavidus sp. U2]|uniref:hypothetical protein n=1 Tax=Cupriavidus sp. U2 TaxID=2920269 RepID=UPI00129E026F
MPQEATTGPYAGLLAYSDDPHASIDLNHDSQSAIFDGTQTSVSSQRLHPQVSVSRRPSGHMEIAQAF